eukprot:11010093-Alexandrium_andersonii.AAC.1
MAGQEGGFCLPELFVEDGRSGGDDDALRQCLFSLLPEADEARSTVVSRAAAQAGAKEHGEGVRGRLRIS